jgi:heme-degrading monooxygenase HmoA
MQEIPPRRRAVATLPWTVPNPAVPGTLAYAMASRFEVRSAGNVPGFLIKALSAWRQVRSAPGALGASLLARPLHKTFYTLSAWESRDALATFARTQPHRSIMTSLRPAMRASTFTFWEVPADNLPLTWEEAIRRLDDQARGDVARPGSG